MSWILLARKVCARDTNPSNVLVLWLLLDFVKTNAHPDTHTHDMYRIVHLYCLYLYLHAFMLHPCENICLHARENTRVHTHTFDVFRCNLRYIICTQSNMSTTHCPERSANRSAVLQTINQFARVCERFGKAHGGRTVRWVLKTHKAH